MKRSSSGSPSNSGSPSKMVLWLVLAIFLQFAVLMSEYYGAFLPLRTGREVKLETVPVDPQSLFRGNYALLGYDVSRIRKDSLGLSGEGVLRNGEVVYVRLKLDPESNPELNPEGAFQGLYVFDYASLERPAEGIFIRGRISGSFSGGSSSGDDEYGVEYGIEAFFAPEEEAMKLQEYLRDGGVAVLMVARNGKAVIKDVIPR